MVKTKIIRDKASIFDFDLIFIQTHITKNHSAFTTTFVKEKFIRYYDSLCRKNHHGFKQCNFLKEFLESNFILNSITNDLTL